MRLAFLGVGETLMQPRGTNRAEFNAPHPVKYAFMFSPFTPAVLVKEWHVVKTKTKKQSI